MGSDDRPNPYAPPRAAIIDRLIDLQRLTSGSSGRLLAYFEIVLAVPPLSFALLLIAGSAQAQWDGYRGGRATIAGGLAIVGTSAAVLLIPGAILLTRWRYRWWPQLVPLLLFASLGVFLATHWIR
jgi:hypothetical protein